MQFDGKRFTRTVTRPRASAHVWTLARVAAAMGLTLILSGCLDLIKPDLAIDIPGGYRAPHGPAEAATPTLDWWRSFRSRELTALMEESLNANFDIAVAMAQITQADAQVRIAGAPLLPTLGLTGTGTTSGSGAGASSLGGGSSSAGGSAIPTGGGSASHLYTTSLSASYVLDFWGKNRAALNAAVETSIAQRYNKEVVEITALSSVANAYFQILGARDRLRISRRNLADSSRILGLIRQQFAAGIKSDLDVAQQEALVEQVRATVPPLEQTLGQNTAALAVLVGKAPEHFGTRGPGMDSVAVPRVTPGLPSDLLNRRPDIRMAEEQLKSAGYSVESARAAFFPTITLTGTPGLRSTALASLFGPGAWFYTAAASLSQPIFDGGVLLGTFELQQGLQVQYLQAYRKAVLNGFSNVEQALIAVEQTAAQERIQENVVKASRRAFELSEKQMHEGTVNMVTLLQVEQTLFTAEDQLAVDKIARLQAIVSLFQALGGGWPPATPAQAQAQVRAG
jgi:NodT family efflux transporter outer membrane factor (OMF) lipoprotein